MNIEPQHTIPLVYQLADPSDTGTYFVRAVIRNSLTGATIQTVNFTQGTGGRFTGNFLSPKDPTGLGFFIDSSITVYTDSGYSVLSDVYRRETTSYLVRKAQQAWGGGDETDYLKIEKLMRGVLAENEADEKEEDAGIDFSPVLEAIAGVKKCVDEIEIPEIPEQEKVDFTPVLNRIDEKAKQTIDVLTKTIDSGIKSIDIPETPDLTPVIEATKKLEGLGIEFKEASESSVTRLESLIKESKGYFEKMLAEIQNRGAKLKELMKAVIDSSDMPNVDPQSEPSPFMEFMKKRN